MSAFVGEDRHSLLSPEAKAAVEATYSAYKSMTRTQSVKVANSPTMTKYEYKKIKPGQSYKTVKKSVGGAPAYRSRFWKSGKATYVVYIWDGDHAVKFKNNKVTAKSWS